MVAEHSHYKSLIKHIKLFQVLTFPSINVGGNTPQATVRRLLQELRDSNNLSFLEKRGAYSLKNIDILDNEVEENSVGLISKTPDPEKKEYLIEVFARNQGWVKKAKEILGYDCLYPKCKNCFWGCPR